MLSFISGLGILVPIVLVVVLFAVVLIFGYVKAPPDKAAVITGLHKEPRIFTGRAGFKIPFFERVDYVDLSQITIYITSDDYIPTNDFINVKVNAVAQVALDNTSNESLQIAIRNFLNRDERYINEVVGESLKGNLRESIGKMELKALCQDKDLFSKAVKDSALEDMANLGIRIISFNIKTISDENDLIENLGIDNRSKIQKEASIAKANADKEVAIAQAQADNDSNAARVKADEDIAKRNQALEIRKAELKEAEDTARAKADAAKGIQAAISSQTLEAEKQMAEIVRREKEIELQAREAEVAEKKLDAEVRKKAEAEKYAEVQKADAAKYAREREAEAKLFEQEKEAEAIRKTGEAEAAAIRLKGAAEAEALDKKADAMKKYGNAAILEMIVGILPDMAKAIAEPISSIDKVTVIGGDSNGVSGMSDNVPVLMAKVIESVKEATGFDLVEVMKADTYDAKVNKHIKMDGAIPVVDETEEFEIEE